MELNFTLYAYQGCITIRYSNGLYVAEAEKYNEAI